VGSGEAASAVLDSEQWTGPEGSRRNQKKTTMEEGAAREQGVQVGFQPEVRYADHFTKQSKAQKASFAKQNSV
jgi:hypothetical protein